RYEIDLAREVDLVAVNVVGAVLDDDDLGNGALQEIAGGVFYRHIRHGEPARVAPHANNLRRQARDIHVGQIGVASPRHIEESRRAFVAARAYDAAVSAGGHIAARPRITLLHIAGGKNLLLLDQHRAGAVAARRIGPDAGEDVVDRVDEILAPSSLTWPCGRCAALPHTGTVQSSSR